MQFVVNANERVCKSGLPNFLGERIPVGLAFNFAYLEDKLKFYEHKRVIQFLKFGFPIDHDGSAVTHNIKNHQGAAHQYAGQIQEYLQQEISQRAVMGPLAKIPFKKPVGVSPLNSVPKKDSTKRRVILDLSFPQGTSVNDGIRADYYLGEFSKLVFPSIDNLVRIILNKKGVVLLFKHDLSRAYRQLFVDFKDIHLLGYMFQDMYYFDLCMPMGLRSAARCCQMVTDAVTFIYFQEGHEAVNYIDDFEAAETANKAWEAFYKLGNIISDIGLQEAADKASPPSHVMVFLGLEVNTIDKTICIPTHKMEDIRLELGKWQSRKVASKKQVQRLCGLLNFAAGCIKPGRVYFSRILNFLRDMKGDRGWIPEGVRKDISWWVQFTNQFNGVSLMMDLKWGEPDDTFSSDSCLRGCGAWTHGFCFSFEFEESMNRVYMDINHKEAISILAAVRLWDDRWGHRNLVVYCDNQVTVQAINSGASRDVVLQSFLRNLHWECANYSIMLRAVWIGSADNRGADLLSRCCLGELQQARCQQWVDSMGLTWIRPSCKIFWLREF